MSDDRPVLGIVLTHGRMAEGMVDAVRRITGVDESVLAPLSNEGLAPDQMVDAIDDLAGNRPTIVFIDLIAGSCAVAARIAAREHGERAIICGVNLPMLLDFAFSRTMPMEALAAKLVETGQEGVRRLRPPAPAP